MLGPRARRRRTARVDDPGRAQVRELVVAAVLRNPLAEIAGPDVMDRLTAGADVTFDELGLDSLARLTVAVDLDEHGFAVAESDVNDAGSIDRLVDVLLASH